MNNQIKILICSALFLVSSIYSFDVDPMGKNIKEGVERYKAQNFQGSLESFNQAESQQGKEDERLFFNKGTSYYKLNDYKLALKYFEKSALSDDKDLKLRSLYNKGNTYAKLGDKKNAMKSYMEVLNTNPDFLPARKNLELLTKKENKDKQDQKQENNKDDNSDEQKKENEQNKKESLSNKKNLQRDQQKESQAKNDEKIKDSDKQITKEEAERILESAKQNKINRKKMSQRQQEKNEVFW